MYALERERRGSKVSSPFLYSDRLNHNRTSITRQGTTTSAGYDDANQMTSFGGTSYSYDRNGNLSAFGSNTLEYDAANKWTAATVNGKSVGLGYDGLGRRVSRTISGARTDYWYDVTGMSLETGAASAT